MIELRRRYSGGVQSPSFSRLPAGYQEVEYLENTYDARLYFPVDFQTNDIISVETSFMITGRFSLYYDMCIIGVGGANKFALTISRNGNSFRYEVPNYPDRKYVDIHNNVAYDTEYSIKINTMNGSYVNDNLITNEVVKGNDYYSGGVYIFNQGPLFQEPFLGRLKELVLKTTTDTFHFIPCYRISDHKPGMYDIVNDVFYTNAGTGEFLVGPDVYYNLPFEYQEVEYLETQGDGAYIKTNVPYDSTQDDYVLTCKYLILSHSRFSHIFGASEGDSYSSIVFAQNAASNSYLAFFNKACTSQHYVISTTNGFGNATTCIMRMLQMTISDESFIPIKEGTDGIVSRNKTEFCLFKANQNNSTSSFIRAYEFVIEKGSNILCNLIPCYRKSDNEAGMYDLVSGEFYTNAGTGTFDVGAEVIG